MTHEEFTGVTSNDLDASGTRISTSSEFSVVNSGNRAKYTAQSAYFINWETTDKIIVYARETESEQ